ncbi:MAG: type II toxin-antitoxin system HicA family toxin [Anaerolineae bacterium]
MKYREVAKKLRKLGCQEIPRRGGGSHRKWHDPTSGGIVAIPDWGDKDLKMGTLRRIIRQLDLGWEEFKQA